MGKESIPAQFFKAIITSSRKDWTWKPPQKADYPQKKVVFWNICGCVHPVPHAGKKLALPMAAWIALSQLGSPV